MHESEFRTDIRDPYAIPIQEWWLADFLVKDGPVNPRNVQMDEIWLEIRQYWEQYESLVPPFFSVTCAMPQYRNEQQSLEGLIAFAKQYSAIDQNALWVREKMETALLSISNVG